jgi:UDP-N-acetylmuramate dehydrogenase
MDVKRNILLKDYTTYKIGGPAKYFFVAENKEGLIFALEFAKKNRLPVFILAGGSNLLVSDKGFKGLVIQIRNSKFEIRNFSEVYVGAGTALNDLANFCLKNNLTGLEWAAGVPGTAGGAVFGNAQAFGKRMSDLIKEVEVLDAKSLEIRRLSKKQCEFSLKNSLFKKNKDLIIISVVLDLANGDRKEIEEKIKELLTYRKNNHPLNFPSAGSVFVNPEAKGGVIRAGELIEKVGLKGKRIGGAEISEKHANFIINLGNAKATDVLKLIKLAKEKVKKIFGIELEQEIQQVGF